MKTFFICLVLFTWLVPVHAGAPALFAPWHITITTQKESAQQTRKYTGKRFWKNGEKTIKKYGWTCTFSVPELNSVGKNQLYIQSRAMCTKADGTIVFVQAGCLQIDGIIIPSTTYFGVGSIADGGASMHVSMHCGV